jgi:hypothetical protein
MKTDPDAAVQLPRPDLHDLRGIGGPRVAEETHERQYAHGRMVTPADAAVIDPYPEGGCRRTVDTPKTRRPL